MDLHNDHNVYILGAGFSCDAGMPLINDFLERMRNAHEWLVDKNRLREAYAVEKVLNFRRDAESATYWTRMDLENIEDLFSLAASNEKNLSKRDIQLAIAATLYYSSQTASTAHQYSFILPQTSWAKNVSWCRIEPYGNNEVRGWFKPYIFHVARLLGFWNGGEMEGRNTFISFNYDTILEDTLADLGVRFGYGFGKQSVELDESARIIIDKSVVEVLKLHGSINWALVGKTENKLKIFGSYTDVYDSNLIPELIPPTWNKAFQNQQIELLNKAVDTIRTATRIILIGFSVPLTDLYFRFMISAGLQGNISLRKIVFVNPDIEDLKKRAYPLFNMQHIESKKILFEGTNLSGFTLSGEQLQTIGRRQPGNSNLIG
jgi:hypothetical protein